VNYKHGGLTHEPSVTNEVAACGGFCGRVAKIQRLFADYIPLYAAFSSHFHLETPANIGLSRFTANKKRSPQAPFFSPSV
jgi:hypothetical protein